MVFSVSRANSRKWFKYINTETISILQRENKSAVYFNNHGGRNRASPTVARGLRGSEPSVRCEHQTRLHVTERHVWHARAYAARASSLKQRIIIVLAVVRKVSSCWGGGANQLLKCPRARRLSGSLTSLDWSEVLRGEEVEGWRFRRQEVRALCWRARLKVF